MTDVLYFFDDVVVKLQFFKAGKWLKVLNFPDVWIGVKITEEWQREDFDFAEIDVVFGNDFILIKIIFDGFSILKDRRYVRIDSSMTVASITFFYYLFLFLDMTECFKIIKCNYFITIFKDSILYQIKDSILYQIKDSMLY
jgi:hypothetical protein